MSVYEVLMVLFAFGSLLLTLLTLVVWMDRKK